MYLSLAQQYCILNLHKQTQESKSKGQLEHTCIHHMHTMMDSRMEVTFFQLNLPKVYIVYISNLEIYLIEKLERACKMELQCRV